VQTLQFHHAPLLLPDAVMAFADKITVVAAADNMSLFMDNAKFWNTARRPRSLRWLKS